MIYTKQSKFGRSKRSRWLLIATNKVEESLLTSKLKNIVRICVYGALLSIGGVYADAPTQGDADTAADKAWDFKFTPSYYVTTHTRDAFDLNLRANNGPHAVWLGYYQRGSEFEQTRTGYEYTAQVPFGQLVPSLQLASRGFAGGAINAQIGDSVYALLGYGRTNAHDYYNLNFDPNDSFTYGLGTSILPKTNLSLFTVKDNRLHTDQIITHVVWRFMPDTIQRWTLDFSNKHGRATANDELVSGNALSLTYDYKNSFFRLARDRKVNFTTEDQTRFSAGLRF